MSWGEVVTVRSTLRDPSHTGVRVVQLEYMTVDVLDPRVGVRDGWVRGGSGFCWPCSVHHLLPSREGGLSEP
jgi:hypothetical protein